MSIITVDYFDDILGHLTAKDLLKCTLVCPEWNGYIGSKSKFMRKITLNCSGNESLENVERILTSSCRKYSGLKIDGRDSEDFCENMQKVLSFHKRPWQHVTAGRLSFTTITQAHDFLMLFQSSVETMNFQFIETESAERFYEPEPQIPTLDFP